MASLPFYFSGNGISQDTIVFLNKIYTVLHNQLYSQKYLTSKIVANPVR